MSEQQTPQEQNEKPIITPRVPSMGDRIAGLFYSKRAWLILAALVFLFGIGVLVPVGKIPLLRHLVYAMGYSRDEASHLSLLKALFSWNDHAAMARGERPDPDGLSVFGEGGGFLNSKSEKAKNKLFDLRSVNSSLAKRGQRGENVRNASGRPEGENRRASNVRVGNPDAAVNTQANQAKQREVFFGTDAGEIARGKTDGFNSVNSLKKIKNPNIARGSGGSNSWMDRLVDKAVRTDSNLENIMKNVDKSSSSLAKFSDIDSIGDSRAKRDMYYAWLTGRTARRTPQVVLKKTLAASGFNGAEMPRSVFTSTGFSGVGINPDDVVADMDSVQKYLDLDKNCREAIENGSNEVPTFDEINQIKGSIISSFDNATCQSGLGGYRNHLTAMATRCSLMLPAYQHIQQGCATLSIVLSDSQCQSLTLTAYADAFENFCQDELNTCETNYHDDPEALQNCINHVNAYTTHENFDTYYSAANLPSVANSIFFRNGGFNTDYFPGVDWAHSLWVDEDAGN
ncbi:MAG: hypothetical protein IKP06_03135 [Elusimicrobiaceae bacterium]|nr:hypothetical protein [Elusimicrobiaceae bacterium]